mgnify:CR=1 FL=1|jgi:hypothetical protein
MVRFLHLMIYYSYSLLGKKEQSNSLFLMIKYAYVDIYIHV